MISAIKLREEDNKPGLTVTLGWDCDLACLFFDEEAAEDRLED